VQIRVVAMACVCTLTIGPWTGVRGEQERPPSVQSFDHRDPGALSPRNAGYDIDVRLDHGRRRLDGRQTIRWRNISAYETDELRLQLYWNAWRDLDSTWLRGHRRSRGTLPTRPEHFSAIDVSAIRLRAPDGPPVNLMADARHIAPDDGNDADRTLMAVPLPFVVRPTRHGRDRCRVGPRTIPAPFTRIRVPAGSATTTSSHSGSRKSACSRTDRLEDASVSRAHGVLRRLRRIRRSDHRPRARSSLAPRAAKLAHRQSRRHGHASVSRARTSRTSHGRRARTSSTCDERSSIRICHAWTCGSLLQPEHRGQQERHFSRGRRPRSGYFGEWFGPYPYDHLTIVDPAYQSGSQGMEYPTLFTAGSRWLAPRQRQRAREGHDPRSRASVLVRGRRAPTKSSMHGWTRGSPTYADCPGHRRDGDCRIVWGCGTSAVSYRGCVRDIRLSTRHGR
jgi:hypothetical protein